MEQDLPVDYHLYLVARQCVSTCRQLGASPFALGLRLIQDEPLRWHVEAQAGRYRSWPSGIGGRMEWDTTRYPDVNTAFQAALDAWVNGTAESGR
jgi:hypothetical protein